MKRSIYLIPIRKNHADYFRYKTKLLLYFNWLEALKGFFYLEIMKEMMKKPSYYD